MLWEAPPEPVGRGRALAGLRVLELADEKGIYCGKLLADLGADVIKIERPGGEPYRNVGPFLHDQPHPERSLYFWLNNANKRSITLNLERPDGPEMFKRLAKHADVVIEAFPPGFMGGLGLGYPALSELNPGLVMTSITPFGQTGPHKDYKASDITGCAMGGIMYVSGEPERAPVWPAGLEAYHMVSSVAAVGILIAVHSRDVAGQGQHLDVSMQEAVAAQLESYSVFYLSEGVIARRQGAGLPHVVPCRLYPCKDGYFHLITAQAYQWKALVEWMGSESLADPKYLDGRARLADRQLIDRAIEDWARNLTKEELFHEGQRKRIPIGPSRNPQELAEDPQLSARGFFLQVEEPQAGLLKYPGAPYVFHRTPWRIGRPAPQVGEHNAEIYGGELGLSPADLLTLRADGVI